MEGFGIALAIISMVTLAMTSGAFSSSNTEPTQKTYYKGGKTLKQQRNKHRRTKNQRSMK
jgi:hypothetical protein